MKNHSRGRRRLNVLAIALVATIAAVLAAVPAVASAAPTLSLSIEPAVPKEGKPFEVIATGIAEHPSTSPSTDLLFGFAPGTDPCASTAEVEQAKPNGFNFQSQTSIPNGPFTVARTYDGAPGAGPPFDIDSGAVTGKYRSCGYLRESGGSGTPLATARVEFTVGGTCDSATAKVAKAKKQLKKAKRDLEQAKETGDSAEVKKAKKKVKKAKKNLKAAKEDREALC